MSNTPFLVKMKSWGRNISGSQTTKKIPKKLQKSLRQYISKLKKLTPHLIFSRSYSLSSSTSKLLTKCKKPKTPSFTGERIRDHHTDDVAATLEDIDKFLLENFGSLYGQVDDDNGLKNEKLKGKASDDINLNGVGILFDSPKFFIPATPDLCGSHRFFISPASSSSLIEEANMSAKGITSSSEASAASYHSRNHVKDDKLGIEDCIALLAVTPNPYDDFRRSMQEILDARINNNQTVDWIFLEELLFCYLRLNEKKHYRYILGAFVDLAGVLRQTSSD